MVLPAVLISICMSSSSERSRKLSASTAVALVEMALVNISRYASSGRREWSRACVEDENVIKLLTGSRGEVKFL